MFFQEKAGAHEPGAPASPRDIAAPERTAPQAAGSIVRVSTQVEAPAGDLLRLCLWAYNTSPRPVSQYSLIAALTVMAGMCGRCYNVKGQGLNLYLLAVGDTGSGKDITQEFPETVVNGCVAKNTPAASEFCGVGELVSAPGTIRAIERNLPKSMWMPVGELGILLAQMARPNANTNLTSIQRLLLQAYSKSGRKGILAEQSYSDTQKNTKRIHRPAVTLVGETTPETLYAHLDAMMPTGLAPRFVSLEYTGPQLPLAAGFDRYTPPDADVQSIADLAAHCLKLNHQEAIIDVGADEGGADVLAKFEEYARHQTNSAHIDALRQIWNRTHLNAMKIAALYAVGVNRHFPIITAEAANWATNLVHNAAFNLASRFSTGDVGREITDEDRQVGELIAAIVEYTSGKFDDVRGYYDNEDMHRAKVIPKAFLSRYLIKRAAFKKDRIGASNALDRAIKSLTESDELREVPKAQMVQTYGAGPRAYCIGNSSRFVRRTGGG